jgi:hypothetical protein
MNAPTGAPLNWNMRKNASCNAAPSVASVIGNVTTFQLIDPSYFSPSSGNSPCRGSAMSALCRHRQSRFSLGRLGSRRCPVSTSRSVGKPLAFDASHDQISARIIIYPERGAVAVSEVEFAQIPPQMCFGDVLIHTVDAALQDREVAFNGVGVNVAAHVFVSSVVDGAMRC